MYKPHIAKIAVDGAAYHFDKLYSYVLPPRCETVLPGCRVLVPFGGGNRKRQGVVVEVGEAEDVRHLKPVCEILDETPLLNEEMLQLALWLKERTFCTVFDAVRSMLPTGLYMRIKPSYSVPASHTAQTLNTVFGVERQVLAFVAKHENGVEQDVICKTLGLCSDTVVLETLVKKQLLTRADEASRHTGDARIRMVRLAREPEELEELIVSCTPKQKSVIALLQETGAASLKELCYFASVTAGVVQLLSKKGIVTFYENEILRSPHTATVPAGTGISPTLSEEQNAVYEELLVRYRSDEAACALLYGVTGSGKTQVYMKLIDEVLADNRQVLVLVPEISLTPQLLQLFMEKYGDQVAVLHSSLAIGERLDEWKRLKRGEAKIVIGTRSAVFAPCENIGLIIMDEEQEHTYKSESSPRYHARDVARYRCTKHKALLLLSSATPSIESYFAAKSGRYSLHILHSRFGETPLPQVEVADMRGESTEVALGQILQREMRSCLDEGRQVILLLNRRGFNTHVSCRSCGYVFTCPSCSISMTYHRVNDCLMCHYCGHMQTPTAHCPQCDSDKIRYAGLGTQRVEQELAELFPESPVLRMDTDTTMSRFAYEKKFGQFARQEYAIMVGTQMVAKGLDFPGVGLVGVLSADQALYGDDFRCFETTFSLLTQVIGRAGRRDVPGKAVIQTYTPENEVIELAAHQDYPRFYEMEIAARKMMKYPPYTQLCMFGFVGQQELLVRASAQRFLEQLQRAATTTYANIPMIVLDPTPAAVAKVSGKYRYKLLMKTVNHARTRELIGKLLTSFHKDAANKAVTAFVDINPARML